ncbi:baseplate assembly protein [Tepidicaulis sp. LMO-SS28]|uniref:baseplate assembly protein n=1 Tax=Tepidicaulis sp. LMO-SS28 TaxID=3447455 RepID=UPI003EDF9E73
MSRFDVIDLSSLPKPQIVEELSYEATLEKVKTDFLGRNDDYDATFLESDPAMKLLETAAHREMLLRQHVNDKARSIMLAFAQKATLDHIGANYSVARRLLEPGDPEAIPPVDPVYEGDDAYRRRIQLAPEAMSVAGPRGSYIFNALSAGEIPTDITVETSVPGVVSITYEFAPDSIAANVKDADAFRSAPGDVTVVVMSHEGNGVPDQQTLDAVEAHLKDEYVRPLCDTVFVLPVEVITYTVDAVLEITDGPEAPLILAAAQEAGAAYAARQHKIGRRVTESGLKAALTVAGVEKVRLNAPAADVEPTRYQTAYCTGITLTTEVAGD